MWQPRSFAPVVPPTVLMTTTGPHRWGTIADPLPAAVMLYCTLLRGVAYASITVLHGTDRLRAVAL